MSGLEGPRLCCWSVVCSHQAAWWSESHGYIEHCYAVCILSARTTMVSDLLSIFRAVACSIDGRGGNLDGLISGRGSARLRGVRSMCSAVGTTKAQIIAHFGIEAYTTQDTDTTDNHVFG
jgi:hypothetical protein